MEIKQRVIIVRAFRQLQEGVLAGLEIVDAIERGEVDRPEDLAALLAHLDKLAEHVAKMKEGVELYAGANALLAAASPNSGHLQHMCRDAQTEEISYRTRGWEALDFDVDGKKAV